MELNKFNGESKVQGSVFLCPYCNCKTTISDYKKDVTWNNDWESPFIKASAERESSNPARSKKGTFGIKN